MTEQPGSSARRHRSRTVTFEAFHAFHRTLWMRYARVHVGRDAAEGVADRAFRSLRRDWEHALVQESVPQYGWTLLKDEVDAWLEVRGLKPLLAESAGFERAVRRMLFDELCDEFAVLSEEIGLYSAIAVLPERQQDVIVLRYVLTRTDEETADFLGIECATVRSNIRHAKNSLARKLNIPLDSKDTD
ncbi:sigma factor-like helix-turn-helix DNA-binding protein [Streptomyces sp. NPDC059816]|uniref:sigma factor-like helix-turn-helix DNA-binding protein n=1 Tax=Streptomyces sp. NPDC059816 TaxID=3346960 RepID=UPI0036626E57